MSEPMETASTPTPTAATPGAAVVTTQPDDAGFERFYATHRDSIGRSLALTLGDAVLGFDAADEAMTRAYERWDQIHDGPNPPGWVYRTGLNWARSWLRRRRRTRDEGSLLAGAAAHVDDPVDTDLARALARLTDDQRAVVVLRFFADWSVDDTADALGIAPGTVKSRLSRALDQLGAHLAEPTAEEADR